MLLFLLACAGDDDQKTCEAAPSCDGADFVDCDGTILETCEAGSVCFDGDGCASCSSSFSATAIEVVIDDREDELLALPRSVPVVLDSAGELGAIDLVVEGELEVLDAAGSPVGTVNVADLPQTLYLRATGAGGGSVRTSFSGGHSACEGEASVAVSAVPAPRLSGRPRSLAPGWETARSFLPGEALWVALDPVRWPSRVGRSFDVYVAAHREAADWQADPALADVSGTVETATLAASGLTMVQAWETPEADDLSTAYDLVLDFDQDGALSPGDLFVGPDDDAVAVFGDLSATGPHAVETALFDGGVWQDKSMYWPADLASLGKRPLVVISHGNGHDYRWYDYLGNHLASWGYVVMAHENNTGPGIETASSTTLSNTDGFLANLDSLADGAMAGLVDADRIGWIGHSRGGEGVVRAYDRIFDGDDLPDEYELASIRFVASIAPTVFNEVTESDPHAVPYYLLAGTSDGDVTGSVDCYQCMFYRIYQAGTGPKMASYVKGAGHNDFNCCGFDDAQGPEKIGRDAAQVVAKAYFLALSRAWLDEDDVALDVFRRMYDGFHPSAFGTVEVASAYRDAHALGYPIVDDFQSEPAQDLSSSGGVVSTDADLLIESRMRDSDYSYTWRDVDPMNGMTQAWSSIDAATGLALSWADGTGSLRFEVPTDLSDVSGMGVLSFDVAQLACHASILELNGPFSFTVLLEDALGVQGTVDFGDQGEVPAPYARATCGDGRGWADELVTVRIPLADFTVGNALDLRQLAAVELQFQTTVAAGAVAVDNLEFSR